MRRKRKRPSKTYIVKVSAVPHVYQHTVGGRAYRYTRDEIVRTKNQVETKRLAAQKFRREMGSGVSALREIGPPRALVHRGPKKRKRSRRRTLKTLFGFRVP